MPLVSRIQSTKKTIWCSDVRDEIRAYSRIYCTAEDCYSNRNLKYDCPADDKTHPNATACASGERTLQHVLLVKTEIHAPVDVRLWKSNVVLNRAP
jgi:hypothetical protein